MSVDDPELSGREKDLLARFEALLEEARESGSFEQLRAELRARLAPSKALAPADGASALGRFGMVGASAPMLELFGQLERVAPSDVPVLIQGETGTGKELVARALHEHSRRSASRFLAENCAAVSPNLLESELFGHVKGAFTGAVRDNPGHFRAAEGGTVFLDEIGDTPLPMQAKLLRVLESGELRPVGANEVKKVDVRVVGATNKNLSALVEAGEFRADLLFRLNVITLELPPLRERDGDVSLLAGFFLSEMAGEEGRESAVALTLEALEVLEAWPWPGNVRELENELRRAVALGADPIDRGDLSPALQAGI